MARSLCSRRRHIATVEVPRPYRSGQRKILDADATVVDLHKISTYYYGVGTCLLAFDLTESADIARSMLLVFSHCCLTLQYGFCLRLKKVMFSRLPFLRFHVQNNWKKT